MERQIAVQVSYIVKRRYSERRVPHDSLERIRIRRTLSKCEIPTWGSKGLPPKFLQPPTLVECPGGAFEARGHPADHR
ncbi:hypothetical protein MTO96_009872 [Rhipicephalus appendiculatus]